MGKGAMANKSGFTNGSSRTNKHPFSITGDNRDSEMNGQKHFSSRKLAAGSSIPRYQ